MIISYQGGTVISGQGGIRQESLVIDTRHGQILPASRRPDQTLSAAGLYLYPGLINAHDHLELNHYPRTRFQASYPNVRFWAADMTGHLDQEPFASLQRFTLADRCLAGGLKNLWAGVTTVAHHNPLHYPLKDRRFPIQVLRDYGWAHSLYLTASRELQKSYQNTRRGVWMIHLAEGIDAAAREELSHLQGLGCVGPKTLFIHGVGLSEVVPECGGLIWCPSSNLFLLGQTAAVQAWYAAGKLALGSDSRLTADGDLLDELRCAYQTGQLEAEALFHCVSDQAARLLGLADRGDVLPGMRADVLALPAELDPDPYLALIKARRWQVQWVMIEGKIRWQQAAVHPNCHLEGRPYQIDRALWLWLRRCRLPLEGFELI